MAVSFALAVVMPTPSLNELNHTYGDVASVGASKNNRDTQLQLGKIGNQMMFLVHGLSLEETEKVRSISPGSKLEIWYWDPPFGLEFDVWQLKVENEIIVPYENRLLEFQLTQMLMVAAGIIMGVIAFFPYLRSRNAK